MEMPPPPPPHRPTPAGGKPERKTVERDRRNHMNGLYYRLDTLVRAGDASSPAPAATRPERVGEAAAYISRTAERVERLKERKRELTAAMTTQQNLGSGSGSSSGPAAAVLPEVTVQHLGSCLHAVLVTGAPPSDGASFHRAVRAVEEAGGEVQNAHFSVVGARAVYTIHMLVGEQQGSIDRVVQRIKEAVRGHAR
ncbi:hypothetical protein ACQ4PT_023008 [Festuca glaucescens]